MYIVLYLFQYRKIELVERVVGFDTQYSRRFKLSVGAVDELSVSFDVLADVVVMEEVRVAVVESGCVFFDPVWEVFIRVQTDHVVATVTSLLVVDY